MSVLINKSKKIIFTLVSTTILFVLASLTVRIGAFMLERRLEKDNSESLLPLRLIKNAILMKDAHAGGSGSRASQGCGKTM